MHCTNGFYHTGGKGTEVAYYLLRYLTAYLPTYKRKPVKIKIGSIPFTMGCNQSKSTAVLSPLSAIDVSNDGNKKASASLKSNRSSSPFSKTESKE